MAVKVTERLQAKAQQYACQHRGGKRMGNEFHQAGEEAGQAAQ